jgi:hypothetical protein
MINFLRLRESISPSLLRGLNRLTPSPRFWNEYYSRAPRFVGSVCKYVATGETQIRPLYVLKFDHCIQRRSWRPQSSEARFLYMGVRTFYPEYGHSSLLRNVGKFVRDGTCVTSKKTTVVSAAGENRAWRATVLRCLSVGEGRNPLPCCVRADVLPRARSDRYVTLRLWAGIALSLQWLSVVCKGVVKFPVWVVCPCFTPFCINDSYQFARRLNSHSLVFGVTPYGWFICMCFFFLTRI